MPRMRGLWKWSCGGETVRYLAVQAVSTTSAVAGGCEALSVTSKISENFAATRYREVVLTAFSHLQRSGLHGSTSRLHNRLNRF